MYNQADIANWRKRIQNLVPPDGGIEVLRVRTHSQAIALVQQYGVFADMRKRGMNNAQCEAAMRRIFPALDASPFKKRSF